MILPIHKDRPLKVPDIKPIRDAKRLITDDLNIFQGFHNLFHFRINVQ